MVDQQIRDRFENVLKKADSILANPISGTMGSYADPALFQQWRTQSSALLQSILERDHPYISGFTAAFPGGGYMSEIEAGKGVLLAAYEDFRNGYLWDLKEIVHAEVFDNYLEMASYLVKDGGFKDAAAVIAGSTLEAHLRQLCAKSNIPTHIQSAHGIEPKKASKMNDELRTGGVYSQGEWRQVQAWLDVRNDAAHGDYAKYTAQQVEQMIPGISGFFARNPA